MAKQLHGHAHAAPSAGQHNNNTTSVVDISEIEDDEDAGQPMLEERSPPPPGPPLEGPQARHSPHLYLYHEDLEPQQRVQALLSAVAGADGGPSPAQTLLRGSSPAGHLAAEAQWRARTPDAIELRGTGSSTPCAQQQHSATPPPPPPPPAASEPAKANLGTLSGVYFPCVQNIFGVILFIRMVWIVGTAGVPAAFTLVLTCCCVTLTTSISLSAIATNGIVPAGGSYFMISRSLGPECGGAVGTMFFLGTTVAGAMYITGAVEITLNYLAPSWGLFGDFQRDVSIMYNNIRVYGTLLLVLVGALVWLGVRFVSKLAPVALFCVLFSIASIYLGIAVNYNGRPDLMICVLGDRLVTLKGLPYEEQPLDAWQATGQLADQQLLQQQQQQQQLQLQQQQQQQQQQQPLLHQHQTPANASRAELARQFEMRRTRALCTYERLRYVFCPASLEGLNNNNDANNNNNNNNNPDAAPAASALHELFRRPPNMSNCDPYFRANRDRIHLERAVPGIASGVLFENLKPRFRQKRDLVSYDEGQNSNSRSDFNLVFVDITTSFTMLIAIYFPSCTGILAGSNRSGDLADAQKSIPRGTIAAQLTTSFVYLSCIVLFGSTFNNLFIRDKFGESMGGQLAVTQIAWPHPYVILIGGLLSTLGASLQSLVGAPRILQGIAKDEVIPCFNRFARVSARGEPELAILFTLAIAELAVLIGNLDFIAPILTLSLVMCYFFINLACTLHSLLGSPNWRPRFKHYHWSISSLGCFLCLFVMIVSSWVYFVVAIFLASCIYKYIEFSGAEKEWGDGKQGLALSAARYNLLRLKTSEPHTKNWRPQLLLFCKLKPSAELEPAFAQHRNQQLVLAGSGGSGVGGGAGAAGGAAGAAASGTAPEPGPKQTALELGAPNRSGLALAHPKLLTFASQLKAGKGLTLVSSVIEGDLQRQAGLAQRARTCLQDWMQAERVKGFADVLVAGSLRDGLSFQVQTAGLGGLKHNTVIVGWPERWRRLLAAPPAPGGPARGDQKAAPEEQLKQQQQQQQDQKRTRAHLFIELMRDALVSQNALLVVKGVDGWPESCDKLGGFVDIWWVVNDGGLLMLLAHLLKQHRTWKSCQLRIFSVASAQDNSAQMRQDLAMFLYHLRIEAQVDIVEMNTEQISDYAYERTLMMEQRGEIIKRLQVNRKQSLLLEQEVDGRVIRFRIRKPSAADLEEPAPEPAAQAGQLQLQAGAGQPEAGRPDQANVRRMHTALSLNEAILKRSRQAKLVILNLPGPPKQSTAEAESNYMEFVEVIADKLERVLLVQNGGREVITIHS